MKRILLLSALLIPTIGIANKITINTNELRNRLNEQGFSTICDTGYIIKALGNGIVYPEAVITTIMRSIKPPQSPTQQNILPEVSNDSELKKLLKDIEVLGQNTNTAQQNNKLSVADLVRCMFPDEKILKDVLIAPCLIVYAGKIISDICKPQ